MEPLFDTVLGKIPAPHLDDKAPLQLQISALDYNSYVGRIGIGRIHRGTIKPGAQYVALRRRRRGIAKVNQVLTLGPGARRGRDRQRGATSSPLPASPTWALVFTPFVIEEKPEGLPPIAVDEPTLTMTSASTRRRRRGAKANSSPRARSAIACRKSCCQRRAEGGRHRGRRHLPRLRSGGLHLTILVEKHAPRGLRAGGRKPEVLFKMIDGVQCEPMEALTVDVEEGHQGGVMQALGERRGELTNMENDGRGRASRRISHPARGLIGFQNEFMNLPRYRADLAHLRRLRPASRRHFRVVRNGVLISQDDGNAVGYSLFSLQERGRLFVSPGDIVYEGMLVGIPAEITTWSSTRSRKRSSPTYARPARTRTSC